MLGWTLAAAGLLAAALLLPGLRVDGVPGAFGVVAIVGVLNALAVDVDRIFRRSWLYAVPAGDVREPGQLGGLRSRAGVDPDRADRGRRARRPPQRLSAPGTPADGRRAGPAAAFRCGVPRLDVPTRRRAAHHPRAAALPADLDRSALGLKAVRVEEWGGLVWICLDPETEPLLSYLAPLPEHLACYHLDTFAIVVDQSVAWDCNWKVAVDAFHETYHNLATPPPAHAGRRRRQRPDRLLRPPLPLPAPVGRSGTGLPPT